MHEFKLQALRDRPRQFFGPATCFTRYGDKGHSIGAPLPRRRAMTQHSSTARTLRYAVGWYLMPETPNPQSEYQRRLEQWRCELHSSTRRGIQVGNLRLATALAAVLLALAAFAWHFISGWWLLVPLAVFIGLVIYHEQVVRRQQFAQRGIGYYERGLRRLDDRWPGTGSSGEQFDDPSHVYAEDLDLFGKGSLFELLSTARTAAGERTLAGWLLGPASTAEVRERQDAVAEMRSLVQMREDLALLGEDIRAGVHAELLAEWGAAPPVPFFPGARMAALALAIVSVGAFVGFMAHWFGLRAFVVAVILDVAAGVALRKGTAAVVAGVDTASHDLQILSLLLARLEQESFQSPYLQRLRACLAMEGLAASRRIARLQRWVEFLDSSDHLLVRIIGPALLWREQAAMGIEAWRRKTGPHVGRWITAIAELEALSSLASFSFEHPASAFPELVEDGPCFHALGLRHPLMSAKRCVPNDVELGGGQRLMIVSGSNMSGKSTLLRSVGLNAVLAWAGAPVAAQRLVLSPLAVAASIRVLDSLQDGKSRFYAEITRLRQIVELTQGNRPVLFLLDELLSGTNSHDRRIGAEALTLSLVERGAIGFITTHDLALTELTARLGPRAVNVHFEDHLDNGRISFDYKLKPGIVERSNSLELMRAVGLDV
jgi:hypothetical protein